MVKGIVWTAEAYNDLLTIVAYIEKEWGEASTSAFLRTLMKKLDQLSAMPSIAKFTSKPGIQMFRLDKKNILFFMLEENDIVLLSIYPYKKDIMKSRFY